MILPQPNDHSGKVGVEVHSRLTPASTFNENEKFSLKSFSCILSTRPISTPASTSSTQKPLVPQVPQLPEFTKYLKCLKKPQVPQVPKYFKYPSTSSTQVPQVPIQKPNTKIPAALHPSCSLIVESSLPAASHQVPGSLLCHQQAHHSLVVLHLSIKKYFNLKKSKHISLHPLPRIRHSVHPRPSSSVRP